MLYMANVLITGGAGFIGSNLAKKLSDLGHGVTTLDIRQSNWQNHVMADVRDIKLVKKACMGMDYVFHLAAVTSPPEFENPLGEGYMVNVMGTYNVLASSLSEGVKRVILASSSSVYGDMKTAAAEESLPGQYGNFYPLSKLINELTARTFLRYGLETISLRYFNTYGMEMGKGKYSSVIWKFIDDMMNKGQPAIFGDGSQRRDFIYIEDVVRATTLAMNKGKPGEAYNVGTGVSTTFNEIFKAVKEEMSYKGEPKYISNPFKSYQAFTQADTTKARKGLGFKAMYDIKEGVRKILVQLR